MAVSCLEQRLTPLTDAVPAYAPWGPFGVPPSLEADAAEAEETELLSPWSTRRGRRCKTWGGYIPHTMNDDTGGGTTSISEGTSQPGFAEFEDKDAVSIPPGMSPFESEGDDGIQEDVPWHGHQARQDMLLQGLAEENLQREVAWRGHETLQATAPLCQGMPCREPLDPRENLQREMPRRGHEAHQDVAPLRQGMAPSEAEAREALQRELQWCGPGAHQDVAPLRQGMAPSEAEAREALQRELQWCGHGAHQDMAPLRQGMTPSEAEAREALQRELQWCGPGAHQDVAPLRQGMAQSEAEAREALQRELQWCRPGAHQDVAPLGQGMAPSEAEAREALQRELQWCSPGAHQDVAPLRQGMAPSEAEAREVFQRELQWCGPGAHQDMAPLRQGMAAFQQDGRENLQREKAWRGHETYQDHFGCGNDQATPTTATGSEDGADGFFGVDALNPGMRAAAAGVLGNSVSPAYICNLASRGGRECAAAAAGLDRAAVLEQAAADLQRAATLERAAVAAASLERAAAAAAGLERAALAAGLERPAAGVLDMSVGLERAAAAAVAAAAAAAGLERPAAARDLAGGVAPPYPSAAPLPAAAPAAPAARPQSQFNGMSTPGPGWGAAPMQAVTDAKAACVEPGVTTLMVQNLPRQINHRQFLAEIDKKGFANLYNYCHLPMAFDTGSSKGFAFINFIEADVAQSFHAIFNGSFVFGSQALDKSLRVVKAEVQGFNANAAKALSKKTRRIRNSNFKPVVAGHPSNTSALWA